MNYDHKNVTPSFIDALKKVLSPEVVDEEKAEVQALEEVAASIKSDKHKSGDTVKSNDGSKEAPAKDVARFRKALPEDEQSEEDVLTEEQIFEVLEEEVGPHIAYLLEEGFSEDEIENIIIDMLSAEEDEEEEQLGEDFAKKKLIEGVGNAFATSALDTEKSVGSNHLEAAIKKHHPDWTEKMAVRAGSKYNEERQEHYDEHNDDMKAHNYACKEVGIHPTVGKHLNNLAKEIF